MVDDLFSLSFKMRRFLEPLWEQKHKKWGENIPKPVSRFMCRYTSIFVKQILQQYNQTNLVISAGRPKKNYEGTSQGKYGFLSKNGCWYDHCWVETDKLIVDLTSDQFGDSPIIITAKSDRRYKSNLSELDLQQDLMKLSSTSKKWLNQWHF